MTVAAAVGVLTLTAPAQADERVAAPGPAVEVHGLQQALDRMVADGAPGAILFRYDNGRVTALRSGVADLDAGTPMAARSRFRIGSLTKTYVATAVLQLVAQDRVRLDEPASDYLPRLLAAHGRITVEASGDGGRREAYGLGLGRVSTPCGPAWGHGGNFPGYVTYAYSSSDGSRQTVLMVNEDPMSLPATAGSQFRRLFLRSFCGSHE